LVCIFPSTKGDHLTDSAPVTIEEACAQGLKCAYDLRKAKMDILSAHFALSCGPIQIALLGGINDEWTFLMNGACLADLSVCIDTAKSEQVVCTNHCYEQAHNFLKTSLVCEPTTTGQMLVTSMEDFHKDHQQASIAEANSGALTQRLHMGNKSGNKTARSYSNISDDVLLTQLVTKASYFVPKPVLTSMSAGSLHSIAELRKITTMFVNLDSYSLKENVDPLSLQPFFQLFQDILSKSGGFLRQFLIDDKGCVVIAMWGVPSYTHTDDCYRGLYCAWNLHNRISEVNHRVSIGLTTGLAYCGIVGSQLRRDYACIGDKVNIAARLMGKAKGRVLVDPDVYAQVETQEKQALLLDKELNLKGMSAPLTPYTFTAAADLSMFRNTDDDPSSILRVEVVDKILSVLDEANAATPFFGKVTVSKTADLNTAILVGKSNEDESPLTNSPDKDRPDLTKTMSCQRSLSELFTNIGNRKASSRGNLMEAANSPTMPQTPVSPSVKSLTPVGGLQRAGFRKQSIVNTSQKAPDKNNRIIILTGPSGTGKSQAAEFFRKSCVRRKFKIATVICRAEHEQSPFSVARYIFWEFANAEKYPSVRQKKDFVIDLVDQVHSELDDNEDMPKDELQTFLCEVLIEQDESVAKRRMSVATGGAAPGTLSTSKSSGALSRSGTMNSISGSMDANDGGATARDALMMSSGKEDDHNHNHDDEGESKTAANTASNSHSKDLNFEEQNITFTPEEINSFFIKLLQTLLSNHPATFALILKKAHYCDEISWKILADMQKIPMKLILLITIQQNTTLAVASYSMSSMSMANAFSAGGMQDASKRRQSLAMGSAMEERSVSATVIKRCVSEAKSGQTFTDSSSYGSIIKDERTTVIELSGLNEHEVRDVLCHVLKKTPLDLPNDLVVKVLIMTSGNAFWVKATARFIREYGISSFLETIQRGNALDALKNLILCRLEKITPEQQMVVKHAAVIGQEFSLRTLAAVVPATAIPKLKRSVAALIENGFIYGMQESSMSIYGFHNVMTRETIYDLIPPRFVVNLWDFHVLLTISNFAFVHTAMLPRCTSKLLSTSRNSSLRIYLVSTRH
jgi:class 3 adenylate cyclase